MKKNVQYGLIFGGVVIGSYIVVKIVQNISNAIKAKKNEDEALKVIEEVATTGTTTNTAQSKYAKIFALAKNDSSVKSDVERIQQLHNELVKLKKQGSAITVDGWFGKDTYGAVTAAPFAVQTTMVDPVIQSPTAKGVQGLKNYMEGAISNYKKTAGTGVGVTYTGVTSPSDLPWNKPTTPKTGGLFNW
jgi:hypothetical protein